MNRLSFPEIVFSVASPQGDLPVTDADLLIALEGCDSGTTYGDYFASIHKALLRDECRLLRSVGAFAQADGLPDGILVRAEKHGALYHPASMEISWKGEASKFALLVAVSSRGREALQRESRILKYLQEKFGYSFLPSPLYMMDDEAVTFLVVPWFSGFHEFHVSAGGGFSLWDHDRGLRSLDRTDLTLVFSEIGRILTLCLDPESGAGIHPWSHAAGDFIVRNEGRFVAVRLTTTRGYGPLVETENPLSALFAYVLDLTLRIRLDREDGVGEWVWLERGLLASAVRGVYAAMDEREQDAQALVTLARLLPSFSAEELLNGYEPLLGRFSGAELAVALPRLEEHCRELHMVLQAIHQASQDSWE